MTVKAKIQKDYLLTEASVELPADVSQLDQILRATKTNGKMVILYNEGHVQGINLEQRTKMGSDESEKVRQLLSVKDKEL